MPFVSDLAQALRDVDSPPYDLLKERVRLPWPHIRSKSEWPEADIWLKVNKRVICVVEVDDTTDPVRNVAKYWPLLHAMAHESFSHPKIILIQVVKRHSNYGVTYRRLASFVGKQMQAEFPAFIEFNLFYSENPLVRDVAQRIANTIRDTIL